MHPDHKKELQALNRIIGQLEGVKRMIEENRYCPDILMQTKAATSALRTVEAAILKQHLHHCVRDAFQSSSETEVEDKIKELLDIFQKNLK